MKLESLHLNMRVRHVKYGIGTVKRITEHTADIHFDDGMHTVDPETSGLERAEPQAAIAGLDVPLAQFIDDVVQKTVTQLGMEKPDTIIEELGARWHRGRIIIHPADPAQQPKEVPLDTFFHKIVMMRNNLRVLEQKIHSHSQLNDAEKVEMQQYVTRCHGSMTTFNLLFKHKEGQFGGA